MESENSLTMIENTLNSWKRDEVPFRAVQAIVSQLNAVHQSFSSIVSELASKTDEVNSLCEKTRETRDENSREFQHWLDSANADNEQLNSRMAELDKVDVAPNDDDDMSSELYREFDNSGDAGNALDEEEFSKWLKEQQHLFRK